MSDQVKLRAGKIREIGVLRLELLHVVFAEDAQAAVKGYANHRRRKFLDRCDQRNLGTVPSGAASCRLDSLFHLFNVLLERYHFMIADSFSGSEAATAGGRLWADFST